MEDKKIIEFAIAGPPGRIFYDTYQRLKVMDETNDGFKIAEEDLKLRGPGDFLSTRQSGLPDFRIANLLTDASILQKARDETFNIIKNDPDLSMPEHAVLKELIKTCWKGRMELATGGLSWRVHQHLSNRRNRSLDLFWLTWFFSQHG